jgi:predicted Fe-S protein YdhL (DUF1289 family)
MASVELSNLLRLSPQQRAELAIALWESLTDTEQEAELTLCPDLEARMPRAAR